MHGSGPTFTRIDASLASRQYRDTFNRIQRKASHVGAKSHNANKGYGTKPRNSLGDRRAALSWLGALHAAHAPAG